MSTVTAVTDSSFTAEVLRSPQPVLVDFWADWCVPCRQLAPIIDELANQYGDRVKFVSVDTNVNTTVAMDQDIRTLPTIKVFVGGEVVDMIVGSATKMKLRSMLDALE